MATQFHSIYSHGFIRAAVCTPFLRVADPEFNIERTISLARRASDLHAALTLFPELGISAYSNEDLFHQDTLLDAREHPENYQDLVVRVAGYSAYWIELTPGVRDEIISRTEHGI